MKVIGLTGGIGSGKTTLVGFLKELGAPVIDADALGHQLLKSDAVLRDALIEVFGISIVGNDGHIDRAELGKLAFRNNHYLATLNKLTHPRIICEIESTLCRLRRLGTKVVILEAPLLIEAGADKLVDEIWVTEAPYEVILARLEEKMGFTHHEAITRINAQLSASERRQYADLLIDTNVSLGSLKEKAIVLWENLKN
jgi:dephospho-CoA kinase